MLDLIPEYQRSRLAAQKAKESLPVESIKDREILAAMINDMNYALDWMRTGREPKYYDEFERKQKGKSLYDRKILIDMDLFPCLEIGQIENEPMSDERKALVRRAMAVLSERERTVFILRHGYMRTFDEIGSELRIAKQNACKYERRARRKIENLIKYEQLEVPKNEHGTKEG